MIPKYVKKLLDLFGTETYSVSTVSHLDPYQTDLETEYGLSYEIVSGPYICQVVIWDRGVHEFTIGTREGVLMYQCDLGLEQDYQVFEEFIKSLP